MSTAHVLIVTASGTKMHELEARLLELEPACEEYESIQMALTLQYLILEGFIEPVETPDGEIILYSEAG